MATIIIKRKLDPIHLEDDRARAVKNRLFGLNGVEKAEATDLVDLGSWSGQYGQIATIEIDGDRRSDEWRDSITKEYTNAELAKFNTEMQKYMTIKTGGKDGKTKYRSYDTNQFLVDVGAIKMEDYQGTPTMYVIMNDGKIPMDLYTNKLEQWKAWRDRVNYAKEKEAQEQAAASGVESIPHETLG